MLGVAFLCNGFAGCFVDSACQTCERVRMLDSQTWLQSDRRGFVCIRLIGCCALRVEHLPDPEDATHSSQVGILGNPITLQPVNIIDVVRDAPVGAADRL